MSKYETEMVVNFIFALFYLRPSKFDEICIYYLVWFKSEADVRNPILVKAMFYQPMMTDLRKFDENNFCRSVIIN